MAVRQMLSRRRNWSTAAQVSGNTCGNGEQRRHPITTPNALPCIALRFLQRQVGNQLWTTGAADAIAVTSFVASGVTIGNQESRSHETRHKG
jgi:hypothetical protein